MEMSKQLDAARAAGILEAKLQFEIIYAGSSDPDQGLEQFQRWCQQQADTLLAQGV